MINFIGVLMKRTKFAYIGMGWPPSLSYIIKMKINKKYRGKKIPIGSLMKYFPDATVGPVNNRRKKK